MEELLWHTKTAQAIAKHFQTDKNGLKASVVKSRLAKEGLNELPRKKPPAWWVILLRQFLSPLVLILVVAAVVTGVLHEFVDMGVILAAVLVNTIIGFAQEYKANRSLEKLRDLVQPHVIVRRDGKDQEILAKQVVPGDILVLHAGDRVVADARLIEATSLEVVEASLTGESAPIKKRLEVLEEDVPLAERVNMVYAGTHIGGGRALALTVATGANTELGKIAVLVSETKEQRTPLQAELARLASWLSIVVVFLVIVLFFLGLWRGVGLLEMFETAIAIAVAAVPEGLIVAITIILAIGAQKMFKRKSLVRRIVASETLGSVSVICSDKTGTITEGVMKVAEIVPFSGSVDLEEVEGKAHSGAAMQILEAGMICNDAAVSEGKSLEKVEVVGTPTETALMQAGLQAGLRYRTVVRQHPRIADIPFDSVNKYMVTLNAWQKTRKLFAKGAPERILRFVDKVYVEEKEKALTAADKRELKKRLASMTERGLRVLAVAYKPAGTAGKTISKKDLKGFVFLGFIGLRDPLRPEAAAQIQEAKDAGVRTIVITGDHPRTALAIGREAGLTTSADQVATGADVDGWSAKELAAKVEQIQIYARAEPKHKIRIVSALQRRGAVVAMVGDGVNDAPALKASDIGVAVGSGTEVAKEASDLVLLNNDLGTITAAIEEGRTMFDNIRKTTVYLLASSFTEIILIGGALLFGLPLPILATQILWINLFADSFPSIALTMEPPEDDVMKLPPRKRAEPVLNREMLAYIFLIGIMTDIGLFFVYWWYLGVSDSVELVRTVMFAAVGINSLTYVFAVKSLRKSLFRTNPFSNLWLVAGVAAGFGLMALALLVPPFQRIFEVEPLRLNDWLVLIIIACVQLGLIELVKEIFIHRRKQPVKA